MARPPKQNIEYFPHYCLSGRTIYILEARFGNDGYAFWFKLLELLGDTEGHAYDCSNATNWAFLLAKTRVAEERAEEIIGVLIDLGKIDRELWEGARTVWVEHFVANLSGLYNMRHTPLPQKPDILSHEESNYPAENPQGGGVSHRKPAGGDSFPTENPQGAEFPSRDKSKVKESKGEYPYQDIADRWNSTCGEILPKVVKLSESRRRKIMARLLEFGEEETWLPTVDSLFSRIVASDFLCGRSGGKGSWTATFDWLFDSPRNWVKILEGNYDNRTKQNNDPRRSSPVRPHSDDDYNCDF